MAENEKKKCNYQSPFEDKPCGRELYDEKYCIFHSEDIEGKKDEFEGAFWREFARQREKDKSYVFTGFVFPDGILFSKKEFDKNVNFSFAQFYGGAYFREVRFSGRAHFLYARFSEEANFDSVRFSGAASFTLAQFYGGALFENAQFYGGAYFKDSKFSNVTNFNHARFYGEADFGHTRFSGDYLFGLFENLRNQGIKRILKGRYKIKDFKFYMSEPIARKYPVIDRMTKDAWYLDDYKNQHPVIYKIWWLFADCGRSFSRWALWSILFAVSFAFIYHNVFYLHDRTLFEATHVNEIWSGFSFIYYSVVTFTTLGFGDIVPKSGWLQFWVMIEVIMGYIMLGGLISILANKLARRS